MLDARRVVQFVRLNAAKWKLDPDRIALAGASQASLPALYVACSARKLTRMQPIPWNEFRRRYLGVAVLRGQPSIDRSGCRNGCPECNGASHRWE